MKCPYIFIVAGLNVGLLAATALQIARIELFPKCTQCLEWEPISGLKSPPFTLHGGLFIEMKNAKQL